MRWVLIALTGLILLQLIWGAFSAISSPIYWTASVGLFVVFWGLWIRYSSCPTPGKHDGDPGIGYAITLVLVTVATAVGLAVVFRNDHPTTSAMCLYVLINSLGPLGLAWIGWAQRRTDAGGFLFSASTVEFARTALPVTVYVHCVFAAMGFAHALPLRADDAPELLLVTSYLTKSASMNDPNGIVGVGPAKEGIQVLLSVSPEQFAGGWPSLLVIDVAFNSEFQNDWRVSSASHAFVGGRDTLVDLLVTESNERQRMADVQWNTHNGFLESELPRYLVGLNTPDTRSDLRDLPPIEVVSPEEPTGLETLLLREVPEGPVVIQIVLERRNRESPQLDLGQSIQKITNGTAFSCSYR